MDPEQKNNVVMRKRSKVTRTLTYESICVKKYTSMDSLNCDINLSAYDKTNNIIANIKKELEEKKVLLHTAKSEIDKIMLENNSLQKTIDDLTTSHEQLKKMYAESLIASKSRSINGCHWLCEDLNSLIGEFDEGYHHWKTIYSSIVNSIGCMINLLIMGPLADKFKRKKLVIIMTLAASIWWLGHGITNPFVVYIILELAEALFGDNYSSTSLLGQVFIATSLFVMSKYMNTSVIFPRCLRKTMHALWSLVGRVAAILAPQTLLLMRYWYGYGLPSVIVGALSVIVGVSVMLIPASTNSANPEAGHEAEEDRSKKSDDQNDVNYNSSRFR